MIGAEEAVDVIGALFGRHPGFRALHAKGNFYSATFTGTLNAAGLTRAAHMQGQRVDATVRFSNGSGDPGAADNIPDVRGLAVSFHLPDGSRTDISAQSVPRFPVSTPEAFIGLLRASAKGTGRLWRLPLFIARHPGVIRTLNINAGGFAPPTSYAGVTYHAVHAFKWLDAHDRACYVRYRWEPEKPAPPLAKLEASQRGPDYLQEELAQRLTEEPVRFKLLLQVAADGDPVDDPAAVWPEDREAIIAGRLKVTAVQPVDETATPLVFDPMNVTDGIEPSGDPVLLFRSRAYSVSAQRRSAGNS